MGALLRSLIAYTDYHLILTRLGCEDCSRLIRSDPYTLAQQIPGFNVTGYALVYRHTARALASDGLVMC